MTKALKITLHVTLILIVVLLGICPTLVANANEETKFDSTYVLNDLKGLSIENKVFDLADYPYNGNAEPQILAFIEYCYSEDSTVNVNYGLYIYLYNPARIPLTYSSCMVQMGLGSTADTAESYDKYFLEAVSVSKGTVDGVDVEDLFWKFKVVGNDDFLQKLRPEARRYFVSGIELVTYDNLPATEYEIVSQFVYTGFSERCAEESMESSTLNLEIKEIEHKTITGLLDRQTVYRDNMDNATVTDHNQVNGVYFGLENRFFEEYGFLQKIKASWYEYRSNPIFVVNNQQVYDAIKPYLGQNIGNYTEDLEYALVYGRTGVNSPSYANASVLYDGSFNAFLGNHQSLSLITNYSSNKVISPLGWLIPEIGVDIGDRHIISEETLKSYINEYNNAHPNSLVSVGNGVVKYSSDLFNTNVGEGRTAGYNVYEFDVEEDKFDFTQYNPDSSTYTVWQSLMSAFGWTPETESALQGQSPILIIDSGNYNDYFSGTEEEQCRKLLVSNSELSKFKSYVNQELAKGNKVVHFRFACTKYTAKEINAISEQGRGSQPDGFKGFYFEQNAFLNFDIIHLDFNKDGVHTIIPVVSNPIDIFSFGEGPTPPKSEFEKIISSLTEFWAKFKRVLLIIAIVIAVVLFATVVYKLAMLFKSNKSKTTIVLKDNSKNNLPSKESGVVKKNKYKR